MISLDTNKRYLITGGTGFLGHAMLRRLTTMGILNIVVLARNEGNLIDLKETFPHIEIIPGDVAEQYSCALACSGVRGIIHAAAFKHVTMAQQYVRECVMTNVQGTLYLLDESVKTKPDFVLGIDTDKSSQITGVYGATKYLQSVLFSQYEKVNPATAYRIVRYGNILYSTGSVLCKWKERLQRGQPVIVTDLNATRFFWTVDQAVDLIFECLQKAVDSTPYVPTMKAMRIGDLLEAMHRKYGKGPLTTEIIGLQPGEKLHEVLTLGGPNSFEVEHYTLDEIMQLV